MQLAITTFNIACLPKVFSKLDKSPKQRRYDIVSYLINNQSDIYCIQEDFHSSTRKYIKKQMEQYGYFSVFSRGRWGFLPLNGGISIYSKYPIKKYKWIIFKDSMGEDTFGNKGVLYAQISINNKLIDVFGTHLQSEAKWNICKSKVEIQKKQLAQIKECVQNNRSIDSIGNIVMGDFNISSKSEMKNNLFDMFYSNTTLDQNIEEPTVKSGRKLDYIFITPMNLNSSKIYESVYEVTFSDHYPLTIIAEIK